MATVEKGMEFLFIKKPQLVRRDSTMTSFELRQNDKSDSFSFDPAFSGIDVSVPEFLRPKMARVKSTKKTSRPPINLDGRSLHNNSSRYPMVPKTERGLPTHFNTMPNSDLSKTNSKVEHPSSAPSIRKPLEPLKALKPVPSNEPFLSDLGPDSDPNNFSSMMIFPISKNEDQNDDLTTPEKTIKPLALGMVSIFKIHPY
jgi:hypothetical protein